MIRVGWLPSLARPVSRRRTLAYTKRRRRSPRRERAASTNVVNDEDMIFDQPPAELPVATLLPRDKKSRLRASMFAWLSTKWQWFKPRTVPMIVAFVGMLAVIGSANYLRNYARRAPEQLSATIKSQPQWTLHVTVDAPRSVQVPQPAAKPIEHECCGGVPCHGTDSSR